MAVIIALRASDRAVKAVEVDGDMALIGWALTEPRTRSRQGADSASVEGVVSADWRLVMRGSSVVFVYFSRGMFVGVEVDVEDESFEEDDVVDSADEDGVDDSFVFSRLGSTGISTIGSVGFVGADNSNFLGLS